MFHVPDGSKNIYFDVDDTLVEWIQPTDERAEQSIPGLYPCRGHSSYLLLPIPAHIEELKRLKAEHNTIVVWSQGGSDWVVEVLTKLELTEYVDVCLTKPEVYYDDLHVSEWMGQRKYIGPPHLINHLVLDND